MYNLHKSVGKCVAIVFVISTILIIDAPCTAHMYNNNTNGTSSNKKKTNSLVDKTNTNLNATVDYEVISVKQDE